MDSINLSSNQNELKKVKSQYILKRIFDNIKNKRVLYIIKYNKYIQKKLNLSILFYKEYSEIYTPIEIEIIPLENQNSKFINIKETEESYYHIYFNDNQEEIKRNYIGKNDKVKNIRIIIDYKVLSFQGLFKDCKCIQSINFKKFYRNNIDDMSYMLSGCSSLIKIDFSTFYNNAVKDISFMFSECPLLEEINLSNFKTNNVSKMKGLFSGCSSLRELDLSNFNTYNVIDMSNMFFLCSSLKELNLSNFNTHYLTNVNCMFFGCSKLKNLDISNFTFDKLKYLNGMFYTCSSLKELNISNLKINDEASINGMFLGCSNELKMELKAKYKNIDDRVLSL